MANLTAEPPFEMPIFDPATGRVTEEWYLFFLQIYRRTGNSSGGDGQLTRANVLALEQSLANVLAPQLTDFSSEAVTPYPLFAPQPDYTTDMTMPALLQPQLRDLGNDMTFAPQTLPGVLTINQGVWTPVLSFSVSNTGLAYTASGSYWRVGFLVFISYIVTLTAIGTSSGAATLAGLPFLSSSGLTNSATFPMNQANTSGLTAAPFGYVVASSSSIVLNTSQGGALAATNFTNTTVLVGSGVYPIGAIS